MADTFAAFEPTSGPVPDGQLETETYTSRGMTIGKITGGSRQSSDPASRTFDVGGTPRTVVQGGLHIPASAPAPKFGRFGVGWEYVMTAAGSNTPADLVGSRWLVVDAPAKSHMTARRLDVVRLT